MKRYFLDLFAGIGGFSLGAEWASTTFDGHYFSEVDDYAIKVYEKRFPDAIALGDIRKINGKYLPEGEWIIAGGFPCQDISVAGKGAGLEGSRSGLWFEYARLIGELRPRFAIMENVGALTIRGLDRVLGSLAEIGYDAEWQDIRASDVGAPHRRERIWIVAYPSSGDAGSRAGKFESSKPFNGEQAFVLPNSGSGGRTSKARDNYKMADADEILRDGSRRTRNGRAEPTDSGETLANATNCRNVRRDGKLGATEGEMREHRRSSENGRREWWAVEPDVGRVAHGIPARVDRLKCLGNSIVPQIAELIFREIKNLQ